MNSNNIENNQGKISLNYEIKIEKNLKQKEDAERQTQCIRESAISEYKTNEIKGNSLDLDRNLSKDQKNLLQKSKNKGEEDSKNSNFKKEENVNYFSESLDKDRIGYKSQGEEKKLEGQKKELHHEKGAEQIPENCLQHINKSETIPNSDNALNVTFSNSEPKEINNQNNSSFKLDSKKVDLNCNNPIHLNNNKHSNDQFKEMTKNSLQQKESLEMMENDLRFNYNNVGNTSENIKFENLKKELENIKNDIIYEFQIIDWAKKFEDLTKSFKYIKGILNDPYFLQNVQIIRNSLNVVIGDHRILILKQKISSFL